ncbi:MAG: DUF2958 domain-containing protein [Acidobacteriaceae bacterium]
MQPGCSLRLTRTTKTAPSACATWGKASRSWAYVSLAELQSVRGRLGLPVERDLHFIATKPISAYAREARLTERIVT